MPETFTIVPRGPFSLAEAIGFGFGQRDAAAGDDVMRLGPVSGEELRALADAWRPFRTWAAVLIGAAARRVLGEETAESRTHPAGRRHRIGSTVATGTVSPHRA